MVGWCRYDNQVSMAFVNDSKVRSNFVLLELDESTPEDRLAGFDDLLNAGGHNCPSLFFPPPPPLPPI